MSRLDKIKTFRGLTWVGLLANSMFVLFIIVTLIYYSYYLRTGNIVPVIEAIAYAIEVSGFLLMLLNVVGYAVKLRGRLPLKIAMSVYFLMEFIIMICDFNLIDVSEFYTPASKALIISHCVFSTAVVMFYMLIEKENTVLQKATTVAAVICMLACFAIVFNVRVYASVLVNSVAYIVLFSVILFYDNRGVIYPDCYGEEQKTFSDSGFFE